MTFATSVLVGAALGGLNAALLLTRERGDRGAPLAVLLGVAAGVYLGFGLQDGRPSQVAVQGLGALPFLVVAVRWPRAMALLGAAWLGHGLWDAAHGLGLVTTKVPDWYPGACMGWDAALGSAALAWARASRGLDR